MNEPEVPNTPMNAPQLHAHKLFRWGAIASITYVVGMAGYAWYVRDGMWQMKPDQFATFLSGVFAPLAFLWLVLGFRQQGDELQNSARALWLQGEELRNSVEQQRQLVEVSREQLSSEVTARQRAEEEASRSAQPILVMPGVGGSWSGQTQDLRFLINTAGPTCSKVEVHLDDAVVHRRAVFAEGEGIEFRKRYESPRDVEPCIVRIVYTDFRGGRRSQSFSVPINETGGPNGQRTLGEPALITVEDENR